MTPREIELVRDALVAQQALCLWMLATAEPDEVPELDERVRAIGRGIEHMDGMLAGEVANAR